jgi:hypothetical protein
VLAPSRRKMVESSCGKQFGRRTRPLRQKNGMSLLLGPSAKEDTAAKDAILVKAGEFVGVC